MKNKLFSNGIAVVSLIAAGLALTSAKSQAHGHQHADVFGRIMHKPKASSGSSLNITTLGAADSKTFYAAGSGSAFLNPPPEPVAVLPTPTSLGYGPACLDCDSTNATHQPSSFTHPTPTPQLELQALKVQDGQLASLSNRRRKGYRSFHNSGKDEAYPANGLGPASTGTISAKISGTYWLIQRSPQTTKLKSFFQQILHLMEKIYRKLVPERKVN